MKKTLASVLTLVLGVGVFFSTNASAAEPSCLVKIGTDEYTSLNEAMSNVNEGDVVKVYPGMCDITQDNTTIIEGQTGWFLPIIKNNVSIVGVNEKGKAITDPTSTQATIYSSSFVPNGAWASQNLITVFGDNVKITGLTIMDKVDGNKTIEVLGSNFTAENNVFAPLDASLASDEAISEAEYSSREEYEEYCEKYGASLYFSGDVKDVVVKNNIFKFSGISFDHPNNASAKIKNNTFDGKKQWGSEYFYSAFGITNWSSNNNDYSKFNLVFTENNVLNGAFIKLTKAEAGVFDLSKNYWGSENPDFSNVEYDEEKITVSTTPWYTDFKHEHTAPFNFPGRDGIVVKATELTALTLAEQALIDATLASNDTIFETLDITVIVKATNTEKHELSKALTLTFDIPSDITAVAAGYSRSYFVIRIHNGVAEKLTINMAGDEKSFTVDSDKFSTYLLGYTDTMIPADLSALKAAILSAAGINRDLYTDESLEVLDAALLIAQGLDDDTLNVTFQSSIDDATANLNNAIAALVALPEAPKTGLLTEMATGSAKQVARLVIVTPAYLGLTVIALSSIVLSGWYHYAKKYADLKNN